MMELKKLPVLLIGYSRPEGIERLVTQLHSQGVRNFYVAIDGAKENQLNQKTKFLSLFERFKVTFPDSFFKYWIRDCNLGCAISVITAIDWLFKYENVGLILEDDLEVSIDLVGYSVRAFEILEEDPSIDMFTGTKLNQEGYLSTHKMSLASYPIIWGWGTTSVRWNKLRTIYFIDSSTFKNVDGYARRSFWKTGLVRSLNRRVDAWDIPLAFAMIASKGKCLVPGSNLISNLGYDDQATHTLGKVWPLGLPIENYAEAPRDLEFEKQSLETQNYFMEKWIYRISAIRVLSWPMERTKSIFRSQNLKNTLGDAISLVEIP